MIGCKFKGFNTMPEQVNENQKNIKTIAEYLALKEEKDVNFLDLTHYTEDSALTDDEFAEVSKPNIYIIYTAGGEKVIFGARGEDEDAIYYQYERLRDSVYTRYNFIIYKESKDFELTQTPQEIGNAVMVDLSGYESGDNVPLELYNKIRNNANNIICKYNDLLLTVSISSYDNIITVYGGTINSEDKSVTYFNGYIDYDETSHIYYDVFISFYIDGETFNPIIKDVSISNSAKYSFTTENSARTITNVGSNTINVTINFGQVNGYGKPILMSHSAGVIDVAYSYFKNENSVVTVKLGPYDKVLIIIRQQYALLITKVEV